MARGGRQSYTVGGRSLSVSSLDKVLYPATGTTKAEVMRYYLAVADVLIPQVAQRPVTRKRWVEGVGTAREPGSMFFRKDLEDSAPRWIPTGRIAHADHTNTYPLANEPAVLAWFAQMAALELHTPQWRFGRNGRPRNPDRLVLDLDPGEGVGLAECAEVARLCRDLLTDMGLESFPVTSGSKGIHLYAGLDGRHNAEAISGVAHELAKALEADHRDLVVSAMRRSLRPGKVFVDWSQNNAAKTTVSPYSLRGRERPWVAAPRTWEELGDPGLRHLGFAEVLERVAAGLDPIAPLGWTPDSGGTGGDGGRRGPGGPDGGASGRQDGGQDGGAAGGPVDRLATYRSMRDPARTAEPVPAEPPAERALGPGELPSFVIQEHHARRLHWDFRLEHSGVLVSWAVPKGPPLDTGTNRLAVQTEDHPLEYGTFEGTIAKGEYGAGEVTIWDAGTWQPEKWREGREVIGVLRGRPEGGLGGVPRRYALVRAPGMGGEDNWLLHLMKDQPDAARGPDAAATDPPEPGAVRPPAAGSAAPAPGEGAGAPAGPPSGPSGATPGGPGSARAARFGLEDLPAPMLATLGEPADLDPGQDWAYEMKWDGWRVIAGVGPRQVLPASRNGQDLTRRYPALAELTGLLRGEAAERGGAVLDGELVALDERGRPDFSRLQDGTGELRLVVFDVLQLGPPGATATERRSLLRTPYAERRAVLEAVVVPGEAIAVPPAHHGTLAQARRAARGLGLEGVVAKRTDSTYLPGRRGSSWVKLKEQQHQEIVVIGAREGRGARAGGIGSLLAAVPDDSGELRYAGRVGTGFTAAQLAEVEGRLERLRRRTPPVADVPAPDRADAWWVRPALVGEVALAGRTREGRLRQASWRGWRPDKEPGDVRWEVP
ncbi:ATP-dependent DNA ligase [Citricoccus sp. SGAir0253]|uniref:ATP-dependent DNA ligase n=1 Tax=Citricoccus sp. SGAir0253 TaxID=2567881 RepID=UPI0010CD0D13|nr:ATP-dependent DNA ligase [Citricoccus sp. SGAir0253]QCU77240.1 ATP-dependent DNA ligase [Citricoccus sp. SGAir0253]